jgi:hypothetical protein
VNFDASTLRNGDDERRASRRAISVFPTPVVPIMMMFFGMTSAARSGGSFCRRTRFRSAIATRAFRRDLAHDVFVELGDDLPRGQVVESNLAIL